MSRTAGSLRRRVGLVGVALLTLTSPLWANGGIVRIAGVPLGPWFVTVYSSPTPLRTGEVDISVLVQDSTDRILDVAVAVEAVPVEVEVEPGEPEPGPVGREATRAQATNKLFKAAKFDVGAPGLWSFRIRVADQGELTFQAPVTRTTVLDRPVLLTTLVLLPLLVLGWLFFGREEEEELDERGGSALRT